MQQQRSNTREETYEEHIRGQVNLKIHWIKSTISTSELGEEEEYAEYQYDYLCLLTECCRLLMSMDQLTTRDECIRLLVEETFKDIFDEPMRSEIQNEFITNFDTYLEQIESDKRDEMKQLIALAEEVPINQIEYQPDQNRYIVVH